MAKRLIITSIFLVFFIAGCATAPPREILPTFSIHGVNYFPLVSLCQARAIDLQYDTFANTITLSKGTHTVSGRVGDNLVLVDGRATILAHPVESYQGMVMVPSRFKEEIADLLFKESYSGGPAPTTRILRLKKIVLDAGHGGKDPGAMGRSGLREKDVNLDIAKRLANLLRQEGVEVVLTRSNDTFIPLGRRVDIANDSGADIFVSIHSNANRVRSLNGFEVYYVAPNVSDSKRASSSARSASLNLGSSELATRSQDIKTIIWDLIYTYNRAEAIELSRAICRSIDVSCNIDILGIKGARFEVLRGIRIPGVLVETGFVSNANEERLLKNSVYRQKIAEGILQGIRDFAKDHIVVEAARQ